MDADAKATDGGAVAGRAGPTRFVVLSADGAPPRDLMVGLAQRGVVADVVPDAPAALLALARGAAALIVVEPDRVPATDRLLAAAARYYPTAARRVCSAGPHGSCLLDPGRPAAEPPAGAPRTDPQEADLAATKEEDHVNPSALLTRDELAMLLGPFGPDDAEVASERSAVGSMHD